MKRIFISGALNGFSEETGFIDNVHLILRYDIGMVKEFLRG